MAQLASSHNQTNHKSNKKQKQTNEINKSSTVDLNESKSSEAGKEITRHHIQLEGWLHKKSRVLKKWRKRWIVLAGNTLYSYKNEKEYDAEPTETINVSDVLSVKKHEATASSPQHNATAAHSFEVALDGKGKLVFTFAAETSSLCDIWISELHKLMNLNRTMLIIQDSHGSIVSFGCKHFRRNCSYLCSCCDKWYFCSYCHDEVESGFINTGHELERQSIIAIKCCFCGKEQKPSNQCVKCRHQFSRYYCSICKFWDNDPKHSLYHCNQCGVCRAGNKEAFVHCDKCGVCLDKVECECLSVYPCTQTMISFHFLLLLVCDCVIQQTFYKSHKCMEQSTKCDCPMCGEYLHMSDKPVTFWPNCGHAIHVKCMEEFLSEYTTCPICSEPWMP